MPLGDADNPFGGLELRTQAASVTPEATPPLAAVVAAGDAALSSRQQTEAAHAAVEEPEKTRAEILLAVQTDWNYCGLEPCDENAELATDILADYQAERQESDPAYVLGETENQARLNWLVEQGSERLNREASEAEIIEAEAEEAASIEATADSYQEAVNELAGLPNTEKIQRLLADERVPASEKARLQAFNRILQVAQAVPEDAALIATRINQVDLSQGVPDPVQFARAFIFDSANSQLPSGVSEATQIAVAETLGISRPDPRVVTGSDMNDVFENGVGTRQVRDPETGEIREEPIFLEPGEFTPIREGQAIGLTEDGDRALRVDTEVGRYEIPLPENASAEDMAMFGLTGQMMSALHEVNMGEIFFPGRSQLERGGGTLDIHMPDDFNRAQQLSQIFFGAFSGYNGELLDQSDLDRIPYLMQFQNSKGDAVIGDINPEMMRAEYQRQDIIDPAGTIDWNRFSSMVEANRIGLFVSEQRFEETVAG